MMMNVGGTSLLFTRNSILQAGSGSLLPSALSEGRGGPRARSLMEKFPELHLPSRLENISYRARPAQNLGGCFSNQQMCMCLFLWQSRNHLQRRKENQQCAVCCSEVISDCHKFWLTGDPQNENKHANKGKP